MRRFWASGTAQTLIAVAGIGGLIATLLLADEVREWAGEQGPWVLLVSAALVIVLTLLLGNAIERTNHLKEQLAEASAGIDSLAKTVVPHDVALFNRLVRELPASEGPIRRLASGYFRVKSLKWGNLSMLDQFRMDWEDDPSAHFVDPELEAARDELVEAATAFLSELSVYIFPVDGREDRYTMDLRWMDRDSRAAYAKEGEIIDLGLKVADAYRSVLAVAHSKGLSATVTASEGGRTNT